MNSAYMPFVATALLSLTAVSAFSQSSVTYPWTNFTGLPNGAGNADGTGDAARFDYPSSVAVDNAGNVLVADYNNRTIRKGTPTGIVTNLAGNSLYPGEYADGLGSAARFSSPAGVTVDNTGNVFVADSCKIRKVTPSGVVTTLAGGVYGYADATGIAAQYKSSTERGHGQNGQRLCETAGIL